MKSGLVAAIQPFIHDHQDARLLVRGDVPDRQSRRALRTNPTKSVIPSQPGTGGDPDHAVAGFTNVRDQFRRQTVLNAKAAPAPRLAGEVVLVAGCSADSERRDRDQRQPARGSLQGVQFNVARNAERLLLQTTQSEHQ